jgi:t-SNARE complex subunit (syntaxin)
MAGNALLPDLNAVADSFNIAAENVRRLENLPQFNDGARILAAIEGLGQRLDQRMDTMERNLNTRIDGLEQRMDNMERNFNGLRTSMTAEYVCYQLCICICCH